MERISKCELKSIERPGRYVGGEYGKTIKNIGNVRYNIALCFPDLYEFGMSNYQYIKMYNFLNENEDIYTQRVFAPDVDFEKLLTRKNEKIYALETKQSLDKFDYIMFIVDNMLNFTNIFTILKLGNIEPFKGNRDENSPKIIGIIGNNCNSKAFENIFDKIVLNEDEDYAEKIEQYICKETAHVKEKEYRGYINELVSPIEIKDLSIRIDKEILEKFDSKDILFIIKENIKKQGINKISFDLPIEVNETKFSNLILNLKEILPNIRLVLKDINFMELSDDTIKRILPCFEKSQIKFNIVSMNPDMRKKYLFEISREQIIHKIFLALNSEYTNIRLDFMIGLTKETYEDIDDILNLVNEIISEFSKEKAREKINIELYLKYPQDKKVTLNSYHKIEMKYKYLKEKELGSRISMNLINPNVYILENMLLHSDKDICQSIEYAWLRGARFDYNEKLFDENIWDSIIAEQMLNSK